MSTLEPTSSPKEIEWSVTVPVPVTTPCTHTSPLAHLQPANELVPYRVWRRYLCRTNQEPVPRVLRDELAQLAELRE